jgi:hypothetical protein
MQTIFRLGVYSGRKSLDVLAVLCGYRAQDQNSTAHQLSFKWARLPP